MPKEDESLIVSRRLKSSRPTEQRDIEVEFSNREIFEAKRKQKFAKLINE